VDHAQNGPALVAPKFHVSPINGGNHAAAAIDASSVLCGMIGIRL
jgi:hypothetical protein